MQAHYCWITALIPAYLDGLIAGLIKKGYMVGPTSKEGEIIAPGEPISALIALRVYKGQDYSIDSLYTDITDVLKELKAFYHSIIITETINARWYGANFSFVDQARLTNPPPNKKTMN